MATKTPMIGDCHAHNILYVENGLEKFLAVQVVVKLTCLLSNGCQFVSFRFPFLVLQLACLCIT